VKQANTPTQQVVLLALHVRQEHTQIQVLQSVLIAQILLTPRQTAILSLVAFAKQGTRGMQGVYVLHATLEPSNQSTGQVPASNVLQAPFSQFVARTHCSIVSSAPSTPPQLNRANDSAIARAPLGLYRLLPVRPSGPKA